MTGRTIEDKNGDTARCESKFSAEEEVDSRIQGIKNEMAQLLKEQMED